MLLCPVSPTLLFSKNDPDDERLGDRTTRPGPQDLAEPGIVIWGAPDDEGIRMNGGRIGAAEAPNEIRRSFYKMTLPPQGPFVGRLNDLGDLRTDKTILERHQLARDLSRQLHSQGHFCLSLGGGHDFGFPDAAGFLDIYKDQNPLIINFDAHLDVRPANNGPHSGTPFRRLLEEFAGQFEFWELGLQAHCNSKIHAEWARSKGASLVFLEDLLQTTPETLFAHAETGRPCFLSLDMDVFSNKEAPGCSASYASGLLIETFLPWLRFFLHHFVVQGLGFYEVSPKLDTDNRTSKLAALIMHQTLRTLAQQGRYV